MSQVPLYFMLNLTTFRIIQIGAPEPRSSRGRGCVYRGTLLIRNSPPPLGPPYDPRYSPTAGSVFLMSDVPL